ncbi:MAG: SH3 domain-containing protein [Acetatifactor sp.]|nr:SH3 domain-containing protein [Acetatifactor sp.]
MKKKLFVTLLALALTVGMVCGCGNKTNQNMAEEANSATVESTEPSRDTAPADAAPTAEPETTAGAENSGESEAAPTPEPTQAPEETPDAQESAATPEPAETTAPAEPENFDIATPTEQTAYTVTEMSANMYVKNAVNLRQGPGTEYAKVGNLTKGQQVTVIGQAGNGWYQLDSGAFVSDKYLSDAAPVQQVAGAASAAPAVALDMASGIGVTSDTSYVANATEFFNYMNQQRSAVGLGTLTWDDGMAAVAQRRAKELATDYSHNGNVEMYGENIHNNTNGSYIDWYDSFYNSPAHGETMMNANYGRGAAAVYFDGYKYYVVSNFAGTPLSTEQLIELGKPENLVPAGGNENGTTQGFSTTGETVTPSQIAEDLGISEQEVQDRLDALGWN